MLTQKNTILIVDDEPHIHKMLGILLNATDFSLIESTTGKQAIRMCASVEPDIILLDLGLPDMDGKEVIAAIREWSQVPIIVLSACALDTEIRDALNIGANDYVIKPFNIEVLLARIHASLRSGAVRETGKTVLCNGAIRIDLVRHEVFIHGKSTPFTPKEYELLRYFMTHCGKMLTHKDILHEIWGSAHGEDIAYLRVYIGQIREKIESCLASPIYITTEAGIGYRMETVPVEAHDYA